MSSTAAEDPPPSFESVQDDPYAILGVEAAATDDEIKSAYKKLCLKWHPDKNQGDADAEIMFQKVQTAWGILSSPELRAKYDAGGMEALEGNALAENGIQVDISQTGFMGSTLLAMFRKLGHPIKTVVSPSVLEAVKAPSGLTTAPLDWGTAVTGRVGNGQALFYVLDITPEHLEQGFVVVASCSHARVKLLLWDLDADGDWSLAAQEDAVKVGQVNATALYATTAELLEGVPRSVQAHVQAAAMTDRGQQDPFAHIFRVLDAAKLKDRLTLKPGQHLLAVYGDNFFKRSQFTLRASLMEEGSERDEVSATEREIIDKRAELLAFEREFKRTRQEFETCVSKLEDYTKDLDALFTKREVEYAGLLGLAAPTATATPSASGALPEEGDTAAAGGAGTGSVPDSPTGGPAVEDGQSGSLGPGLGSAGGSSNSFVTEQAKNIRNVASQASTQITGAFRGLFKPGQKKSDPGWSSADTAAAAEAALPPAESPTPANPMSTRARSFFRAFSTRTSQTGTGSPEQPPPGQSADSGPLEAPGTAVTQAAAVPVEPLPGAAAGAPNPATATDPAAADPPATGSAGASASLSGALFVSGLPNADSDPNTPAAPVAAEDAAADAEGEGDALGAAHDADDVAEPAAADVVPGEPLAADPAAAHSAAHSAAADIPADEAAEAAAAPAADVVTAEPETADPEIADPETAEPETAEPETAAAPDGVLADVDHATQDPPAGADDAADDAAAAVDVTPAPVDTPVVDDAPAPVDTPVVDDTPAPAAVEEAAVDDVPTPASPVAAAEDAATAGEPPAPAAAAAESPEAAAESSEDAFADAPEAEPSQASPVSPPKPPAKEGSASSLVKRMQERFLQASQP